MYISVTDTKNIRRFTIKTAVAYFAVTLVCVSIANIYAIFGHGVRSDSMDYMFLYPLIGGAGFFVALTLLMPVLPDNLRYISRAGYNSYNSAIASLTTAAMLAGIVEIAGTSAIWVIYIKTAGIVLLFAAVLFQTRVICQKRKKIP